MNFDALIPVLDQISKVAEGTPFPWLVFAGVCLAGLVAAYKQYRAIQATKGLAQVVQLPVAQKTDAPVAGTQADATVTSIVDKTLKP